MNPEIAVFDAGPLIAFHQIDRLTLLRDLFVQAVIPPSVAREVAPSLTTVPHWLELRQNQAGAPFARNLGAGERAAIALALQISANFIVVDDWRARTTAKSLGLTVIGSLGLLIRAKRAGLIEGVRPLADAMIANGLYVSEHVYAEILAAAGESIP